MPPNSVQLAEGSKTSCVTRAPRQPLVSGVSGIYAADRITALPALSRRDRARTGSPVLRAGANAVLHGGQQSRSSSVAGSRPSSHGTAVSAGSFVPAADLHQLRLRHRKPRTAEDVLLGNGDRGGIAIGGPGISLHSTAAAAVAGPRMDQRSALEVLRTGRRPPPSVGRPAAFAAGAALGSVG